MDLKHIKINSKHYIAVNLMVYGSVHALVDAACAGIIFGNLYNTEMNLQYFSALVVLYNILAFALQAPIGFIADNIKRPAPVAAVGCVLVGVSVFIYGSPIIAVALAGLGNAFFHVGGGITALALKPKSAAAPGIYVAPGAMGLLLGTLLGKDGNFIGWHFAALLAISIFVMLMIEEPKVESLYDNTEDYYKPWIATTLILTSIAFRGLIGFMLNYSWKINTYLLITLTLAIVFGKALGGVLGDRFGWRRTAVGGLLTASLLLSFGGDYPIIAILGIFLFNLTMPLTLVATSNMLPGSPGFSFGLTTFALILGAFPTFTGLRGILYTDNKWLVFAIVLAMTCTLYIGLRFYEKNAGSLKYEKTYY